MLHRALAVHGFNLGPWDHAFPQFHIRKIKGILKDPDIMVIRLRFLCALFAQVNKMIKINFAENNILLIFFTCFHSEEYPEEEVGYRQGKFTDRVEQEKKEQSGNA